MTLPSPHHDHGGTSIAALLRDGVLDAELAALLWLTVEGGIPVIVAGEPGSERSAVRDALLAFVPAGTRVVRLAGETETFAWLPEAAELGWRDEEGFAVARPRPSGPTVLIADLADQAPGGTWGERARVAIRSLTLGYGMAATATGGRLEDVLGRLAAFPVAALDDELTRLGVVLILGSDEGGVTRVKAAHYLRPVARDVHGHVQRLPPAVLATWNAAASRFDHFAWGVATELAGRTGRRPADLEREQAARARRLEAAARF